MLTLCLDTSYKYLSIAVIRDHQLVCSYCEECLKKQSESVFTVMDQLFSDHHISVDDIDSICISIGPGSYTGVRIAMTIAKVLCSSRKIDLYTISTLRLYSSCKDNTMVIMDARAQRAYIGAYDKGNPIIEDCVLPLDEIDPSGYSVVLDGSLVGREDTFVNVPEAFLNTISLWNKVDNIHHLVPVYLKESNEYYR